MKIKLTDSGKDCLMTDFRVGQFFSLLSGMPGRKKWIERELAFSPTGANIQFVLDHFADADWEEGAARLRDSYIDLKMKEENTRQEKREQLTEDSSGYEFKTVPMKHQLKCFLLQRDLEAFAIFHEQGTGKTKTLIDTAAYQFEQGKIDTLIVMTKNGVHQNWVNNEIPKHLPDRIPYQALWYSTDWTKREYANVMDAADVKGILRILAFHIEGINSEKARELLLHWLKRSRAHLCVDESSTIKNPSAERTKFLIKAGRNAPFRRIMTGTPVTRGTENLYSQFLFLDPRILGYDSFYTFRAAYCIMGGFENKQIVGYKNVEQLIKIIDGHSDRVLKSECLDLPPKVYRRRPFELPKEHRRLYDALRLNTIEELKAILGEEDGMKRAQELAMTRSLRLHQIACGLTPDEQPELLEGSQPRMDILMDEIEEGTAGGEKVLVWARFKPNLRHILKQLGAKAVGYFGDIPQRQRPENEKKFQEDSRTTVMVCSSAAAYGLTLTASSNNIYHSQPSSLDIRLQSEDRTHRKGTVGMMVNGKLGVLYTDIEAVRTVDRKIINNLRKHKNLADQINQDPISVFMDEEETEQ